MHVRLGRRNKLGTYINILDFIAEKLFKFICIYGASEECHQTTALIRTDLLPISYSKKIKPSCQYYLGRVRLEKI